MFPINWNVLKLNQLSGDVIPKLTDEEKEEEVEWILDKLFTISEMQRIDRAGARDKIANILTFLNTEFLEVPYIATYK